MRTVKIEPCEYEVYQKIRSAIISICSWCLLNQDYDPINRVAIFNFWDSDYIMGTVLEKFIVRPPPHREDREKLALELNKIEELK